jgi:hypothetical protein
MGSPWIRVERVKELPLRRASVRTDAVPLLEVVSGQIPDLLGDIFLQPFAAHCHRSGIERVDEEGLPIASIDGEVDDSIPVTSARFISYDIEPLLKVNDLRYL